MHLSAGAAVAFEGNSYSAVPSIRGEAIRLSTSSVGAQVKLAVGVVKGSCAASLTKGFAHDLGTLPPQSDAAGATFGRVMVGTGPRCLPQNIALRLQHGARGARIDIGKG